MLAESTQKETDQSADGIDELVKRYRRFERGKHYRSTPFWRYAQELQKRLNPETDLYGFLWSNLLKVDLDRDRPPRAVEDAILSHGILPREVAMAQPTAVIFFTGPTYDQLLRRTFPDAELKAATKDPQRCLARVQHPALPHHSYRTYHPAYLIRAKKLGVLDTLVDLIESKIPRPTEP